MTITSFRGKLRSGKSSAAKYLVSHYGFSKIAFADTLKTEIYQAFYSNGYADLYTDFIDTISKLPNFSELLTYCRLGLDLREVAKACSEVEQIAFINAHKDIFGPTLQVWGTEHRRHKNPDYWVERWYDTVHDLRMYMSPPKLRIVVDDARFDNEINLISKLGGKHIYLLRNETERLDTLQTSDKSSRSDTHESELLNDPLDPRNDIVIPNVTLERLYADIDKVMKEWNITKTVENSTSEKPT